MQVCSSSACIGLSRGCVTGFIGLIRLLSEGYWVELRGLGVATERFSGQRFIPSLAKA